MPMHGQSVAAYLAVIACGATAISIADSFAAEEIAVRLRLGNAKLTLTQEAICWGEKRLPLADRVRGHRRPGARNASRRSRLLCR